MLGGVIGAPGIIVVGRGTHITVLRSSTGESLFDYLGTSVFFGPPSIANGVLHEGHWGGDLIAFSP